MESRPSPFHELLRVRLALLVFLVVREPRASVELLAIVLALGERDVGIFGLTLTAGLCVVRAVNAEASPRDGRGSGRWNVADVGFVLDVRPVSDHARHIFSVVTLKAAKALLAVTVRVAIALTDAARRRWCAEIRSSPVR